MKTKRKIMLLLLLIYIGNIAKAQEVYRLTLTSAVEMARRENANIRNSNYDLDIARQQIWETTTQGLPQASAKVSYNNNIDLPVTLVPAKMFNPQAPDGEFIELKFGVQHNAQFNLQVNQLIFNGSYIVGLQTARIFKTLSEQNKSRTVNEVVETVTQTYNSILFALKNKEVLENTLFDIGQTYDDLKATYEAGLAEETSVDQLMLNKLTVINALKSIDRQIDVQYDLLKIQMGVDLNDSLIITDSLELVFMEVKPESAMLQSFDINKNIDFQLMNTQEKITQQQLNLEKSTLLPSINAFYSHTTSGQSDEFSFFQDNQKWFSSNVVGAAIVIPLTTSGGSISRIKQAELDLRKIQNNKSLLKQNILLSVSSSRNRLINEYETYLTQKQNVVLAEKIYRRALVKFKQGVISSTELTQVNTQYYNSQSSFYAAMLNVLNAKAELDKILGNNL